MNNLPALRRLAAAPSVGPRRPPSRVSAQPRASTARHARHGTPAFRSGMSHPLFSPIFQIFLARTIRPVHAGRIHCRFVFRRFPPIDGGPEDLCLFVKLFGLDAKALLLLSE